MSQAKATIPLRQQKTERIADIHMVNDETDERRTQELIVTASDEQAQAIDIVDQLARSFARTVEFYKKCGYSDEEARAYQERDNSEEGRERSRNRPLREVTWYDISVLANADMREALDVWTRVREAAVYEWQGGMRSARLVEATDPFERAQFLVIRDGFLDGWRPQNDIERAMIEMLAQTFSLFQYWTAIAHQRALNKHDAQKRDVSRFESNGWKSPYQSEADAIEQAHHFADSYNRQFLRTLRQLRDFRRYAVPPPAPPPVIVNQGGQVNVANQQLNVNKG